MTKVTRSKQDRKYSKVDHDNRKSNFLTEIISRSGGRRLRDENE